MSPQIFGNSVDNAIDDLFNYEIIMKLLTFHYEMTLAKIIKKLIEESIRKDISIEYWSKRKKKTLLHYFDTKNKTNVCKENIYQQPVENGKHMNYQYNSEQMFIICSNGIKIKYNGDELLQCLSEN